MAEWSNNATQIVNPGEGIVFNNVVDGNQNGNIFHRNDTAEFLISGGQRQNRRCCCCTRNNITDILTAFGANIAIPTGGTVEPISVAFSVDGSTVPYTTMTVTPAAVEEFWNVSRTSNVPIFKGCCQSVMIRNVSTQPIAVQNANIVFPTRNGGVG